MELQEITQKENEITKHISNYLVKDTNFLIDKKVKCFKIEDFYNMAYIIFEEGYFVAYEQYCDDVEKINNPSDIVGHLKDCKYIRENFLKNGIITEEQEKFLESYYRLKDEIREKEQRARLYREYLRLKKEFEPEA